MGPLAGLDIFRKIIGETPGVSDQEHPSVLLFSLPSEVPDRTKFLLGEEKINPAFAISEIVLKLEKAGARVAGIPCNTAHAPAIFDQLTAELQAKGSSLLLLNLIELTTDFLKQNFPGKKIGVLSTQGTRRTRLYKNALELAGLQVTEPQEDWQERIHAAAYDDHYGIKAKSCPVTEKARTELLGAITHLREEGAEVILLGCTEIPLAITEPAFEGLPVVDPNRLLAKRLLSASAAMKNSEEQHPS